jgi:TatA/E family protein of Tat protein translocase
VVFNIGPTELIVILIIALIVFGPARLPEIGRTVGKSLREFRRATQDLKDEMNLNLNDDPPATSPAPGEPGFEKWRSDSTVAPPTTNGSQAPAESTPEPPSTSPSEPEGEGRQAG